jgi:hypothetical protein
MDPAFEISDCRHGEWKDKELPGGFADGYTSKKPVIFIVPLVNNSWHSQILRNIIHLSSGLFTHWAVLLYERLNTNYLIRSKSY